jgi:tRNA threonylcarbamoyl adenosine modification protein YjeE
MASKTPGIAEGASVQEVVECASESETRALGLRLSEELGRGSVVALIGDLGAGKTTFVRGLADALGLADGERVSSPSYALVNEYLLATPRRDARALVHLDLYRIGDEDELESLGWDELGEDAIVVVEWPEMAPRVLREATHVLRFSHSKASLEARTITVSRSLAAALAGR